MGLSRQSHASRTKGLDLSLREASPQITEQCKHPVQCPMQPRCRLQRHDVEAILKTVCLWFTETTLSIFIPSRHRKRFVCTQTAPKLTKSRTHIKNLCRPSDWVDWLDRLYTLSSNPPFLNMSQDWRQRQFPSVSSPSLEPHLILSQAIQDFGQLIAHTPGEEKGNQSRLPPWQPSWTK